MYIIKALTIVNYEEFQVTNYCNHCFNDIIIEMTISKFL